MGNVPLGPRSKFHHVRAHVPLPRGTPGERSYVGIPAP